MAMTGSGSGLRDSEASADGNVARFAGGNFPRKIWLFWQQGWDNAPELVSRCRRS